MTSLGHINVSRVRIKLVDFYSSPSFSGTILNGPDTDSSDDPTPHCVLIWNLLRGYQDAGKLLYVNANEAGQKRESLQAEVLETPLNEVHCEVEALRLAQLYGNVEATKCLMSFVTEESAMQRLVSLPRYGDQGTLTHFQTCPVAPKAADVSCCVFMLEVMCLNRGSLRTVTLCPTMTTTSVTVTLPDGMAPKTIEVYYTGDPTVSEVILRAITHAGVPRDWETIFDTHHLRRPLEGGRSQNLKATKSLADEYIASGTSLLLCPCDPGQLALVRRRSEAKRALRLAASSTEAELAIRNATALNDQEGLGDDIEATRCKGAAMRDMEAEDARQVGCLSWQCSMQ